MACAVRKALRNPPEGRSAVQRRIGILRGGYVVMLRAMIRERKDTPPTHTSHTSYSIIIFVQSHRAEGGQTLVSLIHASNPFVFPILGREDEADLT